MLGDYRVQDSSRKELAGGGEPDQSKTFFRGPNERTMGSLVQCPCLGDRSVASGDPLFPWAVVISLRQLSLRYPMRSLPTLSDLALC